MGMYTEIVAGIRLRDDTPKVVIDALDFMVGNTEIEPKELPDHPLFGDTRWRYMLTCSSFYFPYHESLSKFAVRQDYGGKILAVRSSVKNYSGEVEMFFDWIKRHAEPGYPGKRTFLGYSRYEETQDPTLYYTDEVSSDVVSEGERK